jgi:hypothetical protein
MSDMLLSNLQVEPLQVAETGAEQKATAVPDLSTIATGDKVVAWRKPQNDPCCESCTYPGGTMCCSTFVTHCVGPSKPSGISRLNQGA